MNSSFKLGQGLTWTAWLVFIASLFMPMETNSLAGPCAWPCTEPFIDYGWQNASFFVLSSITLVMYLVQIIYIAMFDPGSLERIIDTFLTMGAYTLIGLGQMLIALAPFWPARIKKAGWQRLHLGLVILSALLASAYGLFPNLRMGLDLLRGYYLWLLSFVLMVVASILIYRQKSRQFSAEEGQMRLDSQEINPS